MSVRASASDVKRCRLRHCFFRVRTKRSMTPLHSGSPTYDDEIVGWHTAKIGDRWAASRASSSAIPRAKER